jgi:serine/threonine protein kinase
MAKFYYTTNSDFKIILSNTDPPRQVLYNECVLVDYYTYKGVDNFTLMNKMSISPITLLYMVTQIALSIRFMKNIHMAHLDLKPNNLMLGKNLLVKTADLAEAYIYRIDEKKTNLRMN